MNRKTIYTVLIMLVVGGAIISAPSIWAYFLWTGFPNSSVERVDKIMSSEGVGKECTELDLGAKQASKEEIRACFSLGKYKKSTIDISANLGHDTITMAYRCVRGNLFGEIVYVFHSTTERYICSYKIANSWGGIPSYREGDIAGYPPKVSNLTKFLIWLSK